MTQLDELIRIAKSQVGTTEYPNNSNRVIYNTWYYNKQVSGAAYPWCVTFVDWVFHVAGVAMPIKTASSGQLMSKAKGIKRFVSENYKAGDVLFYSFNTSKAPSHVGIAVENAQNGSIKAVEGNTGLSNNVNGGEVMLRTRSLTHVLGAWRPIYKEDTMDVSKLTEEECYTILRKAMAAADKLPNPEWSVNNGYWAKAIKLGIFNQDTPEGLLKRDEFATVLGRLDLL